MSQGPRGDELTSAEARLVRLLALLAPGPAGDASLTRSIVRAARWQLVFRELAQVVGSVAAAVAEGVALIVGVGGRRR